MVLVRKAPSIQEPELLAGWLRGVAYRTAVRAKCRAARRRAFEHSRGVPVLGPKNCPPKFAPELGQIIHHELERLPDTYREPVVLCYVEGLTHQEAARRLGWPLGTVKIRLSRGRRLLRERLDRRGVGLGALLLVLFKPARASTISVPLIDSTVRAMDVSVLRPPTIFSHRLASRFRDCKKRCES